MTDRLLTAKEAREQMNVSERTFRRLKLPYVLVRGCKRYRQKTIDNYITLNERRPVALRQSA